MASNILKTGKNAAKNAFIEPLLANGVKQASGILGRKAMLEGESIVKPKKSAEVKNALEGKPSLLKNIFKVHSLVSLQKNVEPMVNNKVIEHVGLVLIQVPEYLQHLGLLYRAHNYPRRGMYIRLLTSLCIGNSLKIEENRLADISVCIEMMTLGFYIMEHLDAPEQLLKGIAMGSLIAEKFKKKNLILASDFFYASA